jgi:hypothetical protein
MTVKIKSGSGSGGSAWNTAFPNGDTPVASGIFSVFGSLVDDGLIHIVANGATDFGAYGPELIYRTKFQNSAAGADYNPVDGSTVEMGPMAKGVLQWRSNTIKQPIHSVTGLPYNVGFAAGSLNPNQEYHESGAPAANTQLTFGTLSVDLRKPVKEIWEHLIIYYPPTHAHNLYTALLGNVNDTHAYAYQDKCSWWMNAGSEGSQHSAKHSDVYNGNFGFNPGNPTDVPPYSQRAYPTSKSMTASDAGPPFTYPTLYFTNSTNKTPMVYAGGTDTDKNGNSIRTWPIISQWGFRADFTNGWMVGRFIDTQNGILLDETKPYLYPDLGSVAMTLPAFTQNRWPGMLKGFSVPLNQNFYYADRYVVAGNGPDGEGARARVTLMDTAVPGDRKKEAIFTIEYWSPKLITARVKKGMFWDQVLLGSGIKLAVTDHTDALVGVVTL